jgi:hypothetical protein
MFGSNDTIDFDAQDDSPFTWEKKLCDLKDAVGKAAASVGIFRSQEDS